MNRRFNLAYGVSKSLPNYSFDSCGMGRNIPFDQICPPSFTYKLLPHLSPSVEQISHKTESKVPLERLGQGVRTEADVTQFGTYRICR